MPHATTGTAHACPGASGPVSLKNGNVIPAGNCIWTRMSGRRGWCRKHEHFCQLHNWTYSKKDECKHCISAKNAKKKKEEDARKKKRDGDDDNEGKKVPKKSKKGGLSSPSNEMSTPSPRKTRSMTKKETETKGTTKGATKGATKAENIDFWMSWKKLYVWPLMKNTILSPDTNDLSSFSNNPNCAYNLISQQHTNLLAAFQPHLRLLPNPVLA